VVPAGQPFIADGKGQGKDSADARFWLGPDGVGLCVAPGFTWFGAGLGQTEFWASPAAPPSSWPSAGMQLACPGTAP